MTQSSKLHLAIIPDGNRRWAKKRGLFAWNGHEMSAKQFKSLLECCRDDGRMSTLTFWCISTENWKRSSEEVSHLLKLLEKYLKNEAEEMQRSGIRLVHSGRRDRLPKSLMALIDRVAADTAGNDRFTLHLAVDYGGKDEIVRAIKKSRNQEIKTEEDLRDYLDHPELPDIDLVIRTGGDQRTSNFFLWQTTYAEWMFPEKLFPDFTPDDLRAAIDAFARRQRRFGT